ncbi:unnamed protein product [Sphagnum balticum]
MEEKQRKKSREKEEELGYQQQVSRYQVVPQKRPTAYQALQHEYFQVRAGEGPKVQGEEGVGNGEDEWAWRRNARYRPGKVCRL